jgi:hypothetical protein
VAVSGSRNIAEKSNDADDPSGSRSGNDSMIRLKQKTLSTTALVFQQTSFFVSATPCAFAPILSIFPIILFLSTTPVNRDDRHLHTHAMSSDFTVTWQYSQIFIKQTFVWELAKPYLITCVRCKKCFYISTTRFLGQSWPEFF